MLVYEYQRFACSGYESFIQSRTVDRASFSPAWQAIKAYYAAFFFAHALLRSQGLVIARIDGPLRKRLQELMGAFGVDPALLVSGDYEVAHVTLGSGQYELHIERKEVSGGAHQLIWKLFGDYLEQLLTSETSRGMPNTVELARDITDLTRNFKAMNSESYQWLSTVRNLINYQHEYRAWYPSPKNTEARKAFEQFSAVEWSSARLDLDPRNAPIRSFANVAAYVCGIGIEVGDYVANAKKQNGYFGSSWTRLKSDYCVSS